MKSQSAPYLLQRSEFAVAGTGFGPCVVAASARGLCWLALGDDRGALVAGLLRRFPGAAEVPPVAGGLLRRALAAVGDPAGRHDLPLDLRGTPFQMQVWAELQRIPAGSVITYAELARRVGRPRAYRAVAQACGANPVGVLVPCHRVIASDGNLGGFGFGLARKLELLRREGLRL
ncbi:MAG: methylated-DNA--[protein]-cysteine S-methyltransferase [Betaproteobacteria bacterium]|nr:methylated-DNA--[protein]-cysteine S-methyltransferase [Betaproteobacteria bacterium]